MFLILDMHGAPGGQGANASISDYDTSKPSLWESEYNKRKLVALWYKLAERYSNEPWIGGYDLINETNWTFPGGNNAPLRDIYRRITDTVRMVDKNHILFIEGNWWANDFSDLTPPWDDNMVYSFHKYWNYNHDNILDWVLSLRDSYNVPLWLGECGENSNTWFTNLVSLAERKNLGWSWWPVKKAGINNPLQVTMNDGYRKLISYWRGEGSAPGVEEAFRAVLQFSENHRIENCKVQRDVIDALFRQPYTTEIIPFVIHHAEDTVFAVDYALGRNGYAYFDTDTGDYHVDTNEWGEWNKGSRFRNDGVDIQASTDPQISNGYTVGWTADGEWLVYTLQTDSTGLYDCVIRSAAEKGATNIRFEANGHIISDAVYLPPTGGWTAWRSTTVKDLILPEGEVQLKLKFLTGGANLNCFRFTNPRSVREASFTALSAETSSFKNEIYLHLNREIPVMNAKTEDFTLTAGGKQIPVSSVAASSGSGYVIIIRPQELLNPGEEITLSYNGNSISSENQILESFSMKAVRNNLAPFFTLPGKVEAEDFFSNSGLQLEECSDEGGTYNTGYADAGDYVDYLLYVPVPGTYQADFRIATTNSNARITLETGDGSEFRFLKTINLPLTGGWQNWITQSTSLDLPAGKYRFRVLTQTGQHNLNWINFSLLTGTRDTPGAAAGPNIYPNPAGDRISVQFSGNDDHGKKIEIFDTLGRLILSKQSSGDRIDIDTAGLMAGPYLVRIFEPQSITTHKLLIRN